MGTKYDPTLKYSAELLRDFTNDELTVLIEKAQQTLLDVKTNKAQTLGLVEKPHLFKKIRTDIARMKTIRRNTWYRR